MAQIVKQSTYHTYIDAETGHVGTVAKSPSGDLYEVNGVPAVTDPCWSEISRANVVQGPRRPGSKVSAALRQEEAEQPQSWYHDEYRRVSLYNKHRQCVAHIAYFDLKDDKYIPYVSTHSGPRRHADSDVVYGIRIKEQFCDNADAQMQWYNAPAAIAFDEKHRAFFQKHGEAGEFLWLKSVIKDLQAKHDHQLFAKMWTDGECEFGLVLPSGSIDFSAQFGVVSV